MSISAVSSAAVPALAPPRASDEATESAATRANEAAQAAPAPKGAPAPGTGTVVDVSA